MRRMFHALLLAGLVARFGFAQETNNASQDPSVVDRVGALMAVLEQYRFAPDPVRTGEEVLRAIVRQADPGGLFLNPEEAEKLDAALRGRIFDAGLRLGATNEQLVITEVVPGSGAEAAGLAAGEIVETLDKGPVAGMRPGDVAELLQGEEGGAVELEVRGADGVVRQTNVTLTAAHAPVVALAEDLPTGIAYVKLSGIQEKSDREIVSTLRRWVGTGTAGLILDLRGAGGVDAEATASVASLFAPESAMLFALRDADDQDIAVYKASPAFRMDMPVMVLVDERTHGAAEALAAILTGSAQGVMLIGEPTAGDPLIREFVDMPDGWKLHIVTRRLVTADGVSYNGLEGVKPHLAATPDLVPDFEPEWPEQVKQKMTDEEKDDRRLRDRVRGDPVLRRAVDLLQGLRALNLGASRTTEPARN